MIILVSASIVHIGSRHKIDHYFYDVLQVKCSGYVVLFKNMSMTFISNKWETAMTSYGHVTTASLKQANKYNIDNIIIYGQLGRMSIK